MRKGQLLSMDALLSLVIIIMVVGTVVNTNDMIKAEITNLVDWYDRANIASNMLDILTKSPGYPEDWEENPDNVRIIGFRDIHCYCIDSGKILALSKLYTNPHIISALENLSLGYDLAISMYWTNVTLKGNITSKIIRRSVTVYKNITVPFSGSVDVSSEKGRNRGNFFFVDRYLSYFVINGITYPISTAILQFGTKIVLNPGDKFVFYYPPSGFGRAVIVIDNGTSTQVTEYIYGTIEVDEGQVYVDISVPQRGGQWKVGVHIYSNNGRGRVIIITGEEQQETRETAVLVANVSTVFNYSTIVRTPGILFAIINGTVETNPLKIRESMSRSPWIQTSSRTLPERFLVYSPRYIITSKDMPKLLLSGMIDQPLPPGEITFSLNGNGNATFIVFNVMESYVQQVIMVINVTDTGTVEAHIFYQDGTERTVYGNSTTVSIPVEYIFNSPELGEKATLYLWGYSMTTNSVSISIPVILGEILEPQYLPITIKLWVWDDR